MKGTVGWETFEQPHQRCCGGLCSCWRVTSRGLCWAEGHAAPWRCQDGKLGLNSSFPCGFYTAATLRNPTSTGKTVRFRCRGSPRFFCWQEKTDPCFPEFPGGGNTIPSKCMEEKGERSVSALETGRVSAVVLRRELMETSRMAAEQRYCLSDALYCTCVSQDLSWGMPCFTFLTPLWYNWTKIWGWGAGERE